MDIRFLSNLPQSEIHHSVQDDQGQERYQTMDEEIHVDDINFVVVNILSKTCSDNNQVLYIGN